MRRITISEYGYIGCDAVSTDGTKYVSHRSLSEGEFGELKAYWESSEETGRLFTVENPKCLKATSYVGVIQTANLSIEILPKTYDKHDRGNHRHILTQMLLPLWNINELFIDKADLDTVKNSNIFEQFISHFVNELEQLIHKGIKSDYMLREENQYYLKGKLKFNEHIKRNHIHKERFYVEYDEYLPNRVENRLLKSTIHKLLQITTDPDNKKALRQHLFIFDEVQFSTAYEVDFDKVNLHRGMEHYERAMRFAEVFLLDHAFSSISGKDNVFSMLFAMEKVFEEYMEFVLNNSKESLGIEEVQINGGAGEYLLSDAHSGECSIARLQPDYLLKMRKGKDIVTDAKWKLLEANENESKGCHTVNVSSGDIYQIFSYLHFYDCRNTAYLFVPKFDEKKLKDSEFIYLQGHAPQRPSEKKRLKILPIDLERLVRTHRLEEGIFDA